MEALRAELTSLVLFEIAVDRFTAFRQYYRSPVGTRRVVRRF